MEHFISTVPKLTERLTEQYEIKANQARINRAIAIVATRPQRSWEDAALCSALDPNSFDETHLLPSGVRRAKEVCDTCTVSEQCRKRGLEQDPSDTMIWGGKTSRELVILRRKARRALRQQKATDRA